MSVSLIRSVPMSRETPLVSTDTPDPDPDTSAFYGPPTEPWMGTQLTDQAANPIVLTLTVEGLGGINDYALRIEVPAFDDYLQGIERIVAQVNKAVFDLNWTGGKT